MNERNAEMQLIRDMIDIYIEGLRIGKIEKLRKAFHPTAMMRGASPKAVTITEVEDLYDYIASNDPPSKTSEPHQCFYQLHSGFNF